MSEYSLILLMSNFRSYDDLAADPTRDPFSTAANTLRGWLCRAYDAYPGVFLPPSIPGLGAVRRANQDFFEDTLCPPPPLPSGAPSPVYAPGCSVIYDVRLTRTNADGSSPFTFTRSASGVVSAYGFRVNQSTQRLVIINTLGQNVGTDYVANPPFPPGGYTVSNVTVARRDGQPLLTPCTVPPVVDPEILFPPTININVDGDVFPVDIENVTYEVDGDTYISPQFNTSLGPIEFSLGGVNFAPIFLPTIIAPPSPVPPPPSGGLTPQQVADIIQTANDLQSQFLVDELQSDCPTLQEIANVVQTANDLQSQELLLNIDLRLERLADFIQCLALSESENVETVGLSSNTPGGTFVLPAGTVAVFVSLLPPVQPGTRVQSGSGNAPNLFYWGWYSVGRAGSGGQRDELIYQNQVIPILPRFDEIIINPTFGNRAAVAAIVVSNTCELQ